MHTAGSTSKISAMEYSPSKVRVGGLRAEGLFRSERRLIQLICRRGRDQSYSKRVSTGLSAYEYLCLRLEGMQGLATLLPTSHSQILKTPAVENFTGRGHY